MLVSKCLSTNAEYKAKSNEMQSAVNGNLCLLGWIHKVFLSFSQDTSLTTLWEYNALAGSLALDHESKKQFDSISSLCLEQLELTREKHSEGILNIRNRVEHCLKKDYLVQYLP